MALLYNLARVSTATTSTGTITLGAAISGYLTFAQAGVSNGDVVSYGISDGANSEVGTGTYTSAGTTLTRTVTKSTNSNSAISLSGTAQVFITARAEDIGNLNQANTWAAAQTISATTASTTRSTGAAIVGNGTSGGFGVGGQVSAGNFATFGNIASVASMDASGTVYTLAGGATITLMGAASGDITLVDDTYSGSSAVFVFGGAGTALLGQSAGTTWTTSSSPGAGQFGFYASAGTFVIKNGGAGSASFYAKLSRVRPSA